VFITAMNIYIFKYCNVPRCVFLIRSVVGRSDSVSRKSRLRVKHKKLFSPRKTTTLTLTSLPLSSLPQNYKVKLLFDLTICPSKYIQSPEKQDKL